MPNYLDGETKLVGDLNCVVVGHAIYTIRLWPDVAVASAATLLPFWV
jgi:hypothetical protein